MKKCRVLLLGGARQCGKTTLAKQLAAKTTAYRTLDDVAWRQLAKSDPRGFVKHEGKTLIIDEGQRAPAVLSAIKLIVDDDFKHLRWFKERIAKDRPFVGIVLYFGARAG